MIPGRAAAALPASLARILPRLWSCFLIHSLAPPFPGGCGGCGGAAAPPPGIARTIVEIIIPRAVRIDTIVTPCSRNRVFIRSARVLSSCRIRCRVSRIRLIWDRIASLVAEVASSRAALSSCSLLRRSAMRSLVVSSVAPSSLLLSSAMSLSSSESLARLLTSSSLVRVIADLSPLSSLLTWLTHWRSNGGSSMVSNAVDCSGVSCSSRASIAISELSSACSATTGVMSTFPAGRISRACCTFSWTLGLSFRVFEL